MSRIMKVIPPLHAAICGSNKLVKYLISQGADIEARNFSGMTPLRYACYLGKQGAIEILCDSGACVNDGCATESLLFYVLEAKQDFSTTLARIVRTLLKYGAQTNFKHPKTGNTELHLAAQLTLFDYSAWGYSFVPVVRQLINNGVNPWEKNDKGVSPITLLHSRSLDELKPSFKKYLKGNEKNIVFKIETVPELKCFFFNQSKYSKRETFELLKDNTPAKREFEQALELPYIEVEI
ncbi:ankyrin repeat domain-containing protein [Motilimonas cestriensis]|uniref:ankyrin repeat domain-containing protein n=1 Tax=Motilimonas cestriensis TaxID=2742685 RepID=UPI003DA4B509